MNFRDGYVKSIHYGDIHKKFNTLFDIDNEIVPYLNPNISVDKIKPEYYCVEGDMVFADASEDLNDVGKSIELVNLGSERIVAGLHTLLARQRAIRLPTGFGGYFFKSPSIRPQIKREAQGAKVLGISAPRLAKIKVYYPENKDEQIQIVECLSSLDELISLNNQKLEALKNHKKGLMQQLFPSEGEKVPKLRFNEFERDGEWKLRILKKFVKERDELSSGNLPLYSLTIEDGITPKMERYERSFLVNSEESAYKVVYPNDFAYNPMNLRVGAIAKHNSRFIVMLSKYYNIFYCNSTVDSSFCELYFRSKRLLAFYDKFATGTLIEKRRVHFSDFIKFEFLFPELNEQKKIADCLLSIDQQIKNQSQKIETLLIHKKGLLQGLFPNISERS